MAKKPIQTVYSNGAVIRYRPGEFYIDFYQLSAEKPTTNASDPEVRVYMNPETIIGFSNNLQNTVQEFIEKYIKPRRQKQ